ncbi:MAG: acetyl-CoA decarbonylase/synthase complex subunit gamma [Chloroflexi bacterium]|nr:MAG: acetyl-CoA decarbonylase/synthase complex subunit gamma [Chloroflexota bacterium]MBL1197210.1 acetyl-CoA decarbonylase/synthase complex subunit gamma [Chloroflexota bacterium]NOH14504.1 acetyl-CoA decarbonylase/synthase complex subunit gamma [Chloroflexota bacterium]
MALTGIEIYKLLPQTNCKDCDYPTCLAFAMKLAAKQAELSACPHVSEESKAQLAASSEPPVRLVTLSANGHEAKAGNEVVLFRHEKTFYNKPGLFVRVKDDMSADEIKTKVSPADAYNVVYVGIELEMDGLAVEAVSGDPNAFAAAIRVVREVSQRPLILISKDPAVMTEGLRAIDGEKPLIYAADQDNWEAMAELALQHETSLAVFEEDLDALAALTQKLKDKGVDDLVLDSGARSLNQLLATGTQIRRLALKENFRPLGFPIITFPGDADEPAMESVLAAQSIAKYAGFIVLDTFTPELIYPLLVLRENIYTDPQKPIQVQPGLYEINDPKPDDALLVTTNFSITYFSVANEVESAGQSAWLLVTDAEGMSVLTAWAAGKFDSERIAKDVKRFEVDDKVSNKQLVLPGHVAVLSGEVEEELPDWQVRVGPREAVDLPAFIKQVLTA